MDFKWSVGVVAGWNAKPTLNRCWEVRTDCSSKQEGLGDWPRLLHNPRRRDQEELLDHVGDGRKLFAQLRGKNRAYLHIRQD